jgi:hypothetical protein
MSCERVRWAVYRTFYFVVVGLFPLYMGLRARVDFGRICFNTPTFGAAGNPG